MAEILKAESITILRGNKKICQQFSIVIQASECWGLLGSNGRGKTTLLHTLNGLLKPQEGNIFLTKENLWQISRKRIAQRMGLLLQNEQSIFSTSVIHTIRLGRYANKIGKQEELELSDILDALHLKKFVHNDFLALSGGEQRRVSIARILFQKPSSLYLLDEPLNHLDPSYQEIVLQRFGQLCREGAAIIIAGHDINLMQKICSHFILLFENGEVIAGPSIDVLTHKNLSKVYTLLDK